MGCLVRARILFAAALIPLAAAPSSADSLTFDQALSLAETQSPAIAASRLEVPVAQAGIDVARQIPNPELAFEETNDTPRDTLSFTFPVEVGGKRGKRIDVAEAGVAVAEAAFTRAGIDLRGRVRRAFYGLIAAKRSAEDAADLADLASRSTAAVSERFESGEAPKLELLQARMASAQTASAAATAEALVDTKRVELNVLLGRKADADTTIEGDLGEGSVPAIAEVEALSTHGGSELAILDRRIAEQSERVRLARAARWPDFGLTAGVTHRDPDFDWGWLAGVSLTLPLFHNHGAEVRVEMARLTQLQAQREAQAASILASVLTARSLADARGRQYARYRDEILPTATEVESMAEESYRAGETGLLAMVQSISATRDARARAIDAGLAYQEALADLEEAMGAPLP